MMKRRQCLGAAATAPLWWSAMASPAQAQRTWPSGNLQLVVPFPPASSPDLVARFLSEPLSKALGVPVVVVNRPGAGGIVGTSAVAKARPDGSTWLFTIQGPLVTSPFLQKRLSYDPQRDLAPVSLVATSPNVLVVPASLGVRSLGEFEQRARSQPGALTYASIGTGSASHLAMAWYANRARFDMLHVAYGGFPQVVQALKVNEVQAAFMVPGVAMPHVQSGDLRALGVTSVGRVASLPSLQSFVEMGHAGFEAVSWQAVLAPAKTPAPIVRRMSEEIVRIVRSENFRRQMMGMHFTAVGTAPEALTNLMLTERDRWGRVIRAAGVAPI